MITAIFLSGDLSALFSLYKETGAMFIGAGFACAALAVLKKAISNHERTREEVIKYLVALIVFLLIWSLI